LNLASADAMRAFGRRLGEALLQAGTQPLVVAIEGELGAGKTTLVGGILSAAGVTGAVRSPTYTLIEPYEVGGGRHIYHLDLYRLADPYEVDALGIRDLLHTSALLLVEWPSRGAGRLPPVDLDVWIQYAPVPEPGRSLAISATSSAGHKLLERIITAVPE
jgi:tRNA threonylcarbamoyladenosine biosynthesis protein TsaE